MSKTCSKAGCGGGVAHRGLCDSHYKKALRMRLYGHRDVTLLVERIGKLRALRWPWKKIGDAAGVAASTVRYIYIGHQSHVLPETYDALMAIVMPEEHPVTVVGLQRRVRALARMGWACADVAEHMGTTEKTVRSAVVKGRFGREFGRRLARVYDQLSDVTGPSPEAAKQARARGYAPPMAWDEDTIDNPAATSSGAAGSRSEAAVGDLDEVAVMHGVAGDFTWEQLGPLERKAVVAHLQRCGVPPTAIALRLQAPLENVTKVLWQLRDAARRAQRRAS